LSASPAIPPAAYRYRWLDSGGDTLSFTSNITLDTGGTYRLVVQDTVNGCFRERFQTIDVDQNFPDVVLNDPFALGCERRTSLVSATGSSEGPSLSSFWESPDGVFNMTANPYQIQAREAGAYVFNLRDGSNGCITRDSVQVDRLAQSIIGLELEVEQPNCEVDLEGSVMVMGVEGGTPPFRYRINGGLLTDRMFYPNLPLGTHELTVVDDSGCEQTESFILVEGLPVLVALGPDTTIQLGDSIALDFTTNLTRWDTLFWTSEGPIPTQGMAPMVVTPDRDYVYQLTLRDTSGCVGSDFIRIGVFNDIGLFVPNAFSPNGDNQNDLFFPYSGPQVKSVRSFQVFDRWGNLLHEANDFNTGDPAYGWDGTLNGQLMNTNTFVWRLELELADGEVIFRYGDVVLMR
ncbi:MAG: T9SS type B sorting domain-containing protein, partial [Bacteroidota bacterium]